MTHRGADREIFGQTDDGLSVYRVHLTGGGLTASIFTWGATLQDLRLVGHEPPLVLGFEHFEDYPAHAPYFGATVGRFANRIANGSFEVDGHSFQTDRNFLDRHTLHGGAGGLGRRNWTIADLGTSHVTLTIDDPDGMMGFPGACAITCDYSLKTDGVLHIAFTTRVAAPTPVSLAHHSYFNLHSGADCRDHHVEIFADSYLPVNDELIPTGVIQPVANTPFDFRNPKAIGQDISEDLIYDHNFCLAHERHNLRDIAHVRSEVSGVSMDVATTEPGLQFYAGHKISTPVPGLTNKPYGPYAGFCMETQAWPDAPNQSAFPNSIVRPEEPLRQVTEYRFQCD